MPSLASSRAPRRILSPYQLPPSIHRPSPSPARTRAPTHAARTEYAQSHHLTHLYSYTISGISGIYEAQSVTGPKLAGYKRNDADATVGGWVEGHKDVDFLSQFRTALQIHASVRMPPPGTEAIAVGLGDRPSERLSPAERASASEQSLALQQARSRKVSLHSGLNITKSVRMLLPSQDGPLTWRSSEFPDL